jgi:hypothetical protein
MAIMDGQFNDAVSGPRGLDQHPVAVNCSVCPLPMEATGGVTFMAVKTAGVTVKAAVPLMSELGSVAVMVDTPVLSALASPWEPVALEMLAIRLLDEDQVTELVMFCVDRSEYRPVAVNCWV